MYLQFLQYALQVLSGKQYLPQLYYLVVHSIPGCIILLQVKQFALLPKEWSIDGGELTPKLSLKRKVILEKNKEIIEKIYKDAENYHPETK